MVCVAGKRRRTISPGQPRITHQAAARYNQALAYGRYDRLPTDALRQAPTTEWPPENVALLERFREWLLSGGSSRETIVTLYIPMAGHALGLNLKPHTDLSLDGDLERALDFVKSKSLSAEWIDMCRCALDKFRQFLRQERGLSEVRLCTPDFARYTRDLPAWLVHELERYQHLMQSHWRPARLNQRITGFW